MITTTRVPLDGGLEARVGMGGGKLAVRLFRRDTGNPAAGWRLTSAGFRIAPHLATVLAEVIVRASRREVRQATEAQLWVPLAGDDAT